MMNNQKINIKKNKIEAWVGFLVARVVFAVIARETDLYAIIKSIVKSKKEESQKVIDEQFKKQIEVTIKESA